jgi:hypothetical protein
LELANILLELSGKNLQDAKKNYLKALELHLYVLREKATEAIVI